MLYYSPLSKCCCTTPHYLNAAALLVSARLSTAAADSCVKGSAVAEYSLGVMHELGRGVTHSVSIPCLALSTLPFLAAHTEMSPASPSDAML